MHQSSSFFIRKMGYMALALVLGVNALTFLYAACHSLFSLRDLTSPEAAIIYPIKGLLTGRWPLYRDFSLPPYGTTPYTPLYYLICAAFSLLTDKSAYMIYIVSRLLTLVFTLGSAFLVRKIYSLLQRDEEPTYPLSQLIPFTILTLIAWGFSARPDMMAVMFSLMGMFVCLHGKAGFRQLCSGALVLALAWGCKQSFIAAPCAVFIALLFEKAWRRAGLFMLAYLTGVGLLVAVTQYVSGGWFTINIITGNVTTLHPDQVYWLTLDGYLYLAPFIAGAALLGGVVHYREFFHHPRARCIALYFAGSAALNMAACMKEGAYFNYMLEPLFAASIIAAFGVQWLLKYAYGALSASLLLVASLVFSYHSYNHFDGAPENAIAANNVYENARIRTIVDKINNIPGDVLVYNLSLALRSEKPVLVTDLFNTRYLELRDRLSTLPLGRRIMRREISAIVAPAGCQPSPPGISGCNSWPPSLQQMIARYYEPHETLNDQVFWYPRFPH